MSSSRENRGPRVFDYSRSDQRLCLVTLAYRQFHRKPTGSAERPERHLAIRDVIRGCSSNIEVAVLTNSLTEALKELKIVPPGGASSS
jgi:hypothetical protein